MARKIMAADLFCGAGGTSTGLAQACAELDLGLSLLATSILWTANMRALRHVLAQRTAPGAEEEIRLVFDQVGHIAHSRWPAIFQDFTREYTGQWKPAHEKI